MLLTATSTDVYTFNAPVNTANNSTDEELRSMKRRKKINWMAALDYFSCRNAHDLPLHEDLEGNRHGEIMENYVSRYNNSNRRFLCWRVLLTIFMLSLLIIHLYETSRYKLYYQDDDMKRLAVLPMLHEVVLKEFLRRVNALGYTTSKENDNSHTKISSDSKKVCISIHVKPTRSFIWIHYDNLSFW